MKAFAMGNMGGSIGGILAGLLEAAQRDHDENCICRRGGGPATPEDWLKRQVRETENFLEATKLKMAALQAPVREDGKVLMGVSIFGFPVGDLTFYQVITTFGNEGSEEYTVVHEDQREGKGIKEYNVHGVGAVHQTIESIQDALNAEAQAAHDAAEFADKPADSPLQ